MRCYQFIAVCAACIACFVAADLIKSTSAGASTIGGRTASLLASGTEGRGAAGPAATFRDPVTMGARGL